MEIVTIEEIKLLENFLWKYIAPYEPEKAYAIFTKAMETLNGIYRVVNPDFFIHAPDENYFKSTETEGFYEVGYKTYFTTS